MEEVAKSEVVVVEAEAAEVSDSLSQKLPQPLCLWSVPGSGCSPLSLAQVTSSCDFRLVTSVPGLCSAWCAVAAVFGLPVTSSL